MARAPKSRRRLVVKVGSSSLTDDNGKLSVEKMQNIVSQLTELHDSNQWQVVLVSSGAIAAGIGKLNWKRENITIPEKQAAAAVGQTVLMEMYGRLFERAHIAVGQLLLSRSDIEDRKRFIHIRNTISALMHHGVIPIVNENDTVAVEEIRFGDNDTLASLMALVTEADRLILLTDIDGLYTGNPKNDETAIKLSEVSNITREIELIAGEATSSAGTGGMRTKVSAAKMAVQAGIEVMIASSNERQVLNRLCAGERIGTWFQASKTPMARRKSWLTFGPQPEGVLVVDSGAEKALVMDTGSLLLPGIAAVEGTFQEGDVVEIKTELGQVIGKGITNYSAHDVTALLESRQTGERRNNRNEVVHRNDMVLMEGGLQRGENKS